MHPKAMARGEASRARKSCGFSNKGDRPTPLCEGVDAAYLRAQVREWDRDGQSGIVRRNKSRQQETRAMIPSVNFARGFAACLAALTWGGIGTASALDYPTRPVRWIVTYTPGGATDIPARIFGAMAVGTARPAVHRREQAGRRQQSRHRSRRSSRRPTATRCCWSIRPTPSTQRSIRSCQFQFPARHRSGRRLHARAERDGSAIRRCRPRPSPSSSPTPRPIRARSTATRPATARRSISRASCSR